jgi:hypothetical protein
MKILAFVTVFFLGSIAGLYVRDHQYKPAREYQIRLEMDSAYLYDGNRLVGSCSYEEGDGSGIDSLILKDNL